MLVGLAGVIGPAAPVFRMLWRLRVPADLLELAALLAAQVVVTAILLTVSARMRRGTMLHILRQERIRPAVCFTCGYDLRATQGQICPECGQVVAGP